MYQKHSYTTYPREKQRKLWINILYGRETVDKLAIKGKIFRILDKGRIEK